MSKKKDDERSDLVRAAEALDVELGHFTELARQIKKEPLASQKSLDRTLGLFKQVGEADGKIGAALSGLVETINKVRDTQQKEVESVNARAKELEERIAVFRELEARYEALGKIALSVNQVLLGLGGAKALEKPGEVASALPELVTSLDRASETAKELAGQTEEKGFPDLARSTEQLRAQLLAAKNKLGLLAKKLGAP